MIISLSPTWQRAEQVKYSSGKEVWAEEVTLPENFAFKLVSALKTEASGLGERML